MIDNGTIYLSGAMEFATDGKLGADWRKLASVELRGMGYTPLDIAAMDVGYTKMYNSSIDCTVRGVNTQHDLLRAKANIRHHFVLADLNLIDKHSDAMIIKYDEGVRRGAGTISECQHAFNHEVPIFLVNSYQDSNQIPGWLYALTTKVFNSFEELYQYLGELPAGILKKDAYGNRRSNNHYLCSLCGAVEEKHGDYFVSKVSPTYCKSCVDVVRRSREENEDRYEYFIEYMGEQACNN